LRSIRSRLVVWLVGGLTIGVVAVLVATYTLTRKQIGELFDEELKQVAHAVQLRDEPGGRGARVRIARPGFFLAVRAYDRSGRVHFQTALPTLPVDLPQVFEEGLARIDTAEGSWKIYTHVTEEGVVQVGQPAATRDALARELSLRVVVPMLVLALLLTLLVAWALRSGLAPLDEASRRVSDRDASRLDPLPVDNVPEELLPLVSQINALLERLAASRDVERRFLADAAHELRSPVAALALQVQLAERAQTTQARAAAFEELRRGTERARRLVQQLLDFARLEPGVTAEQRLTVNLSALVREVVGVFSARAEELEVDLGADAPLSVSADGYRSELRSALDNLIDNALRYAPARSAVTVAVRQEGMRARVTVTDVGPGIPPAERARVFERFHRVAGDDTPGTGLGLAIVKTIVERHGGSIALREAVNGAGLPGLAVEIELPAA
jgi:two-component system, OmpR family, sensor kinase